LVQDGESSYVTLNRGGQAFAFFEKSAGKEMKLPPANAFSAPAIPAAKSKKMA